MNNKYSGTVYLVGAGPGDSELLTIKAHRLLKSCDAIVYDYLVSEEVLRIARKNCQLVLVGKRKDQHSIPQVEINALLLKMSNQYRSIVRLKGGDPFLFGRGAEEAAFLESNAINVEVVPGITSGIAAPAYAGIPVTHREAGSSITFVTGHERFGNNKASVNWQLLAKASDGLVIYMGLHNIVGIVNDLINGGMNPLTPAAVIQQGTVIGQKVKKTHVDKLVYTVEHYGFVSPSIIIIGKVVDFQVESCVPPLANVTMPIPLNSQQYVETSDK